MFFKGLFACLLVVTINYPLNCRGHAQNFGCNHCLRNCMKNQCNMSKSCQFNFPIGSGAETFGLNNNKTPSTLDGILVDYTLNYFATIANVDDEDTTNFLPMSTYIEFADSFTSSTSALATYWSGNGTEFPYLPYAEIVQNSTDLCSQSFGYYAWGFSEKEWTGSCQTGPDQSPINIPVLNESNQNIDRLIVRNFNLSLSFNNFDAPQPMVWIINNALTILVMNGASRSITLESETIIFNRAEIRIPSEHLIGGIRYPMELQMIFVDKRVIISFFFVLGTEANTEMAKIAQELINITEAGGVNEPLDLAWDKLMGIDQGPLQFYRYNGTSTVPPCEFTEWLINSNTQTITPQDYEKFLALQRCKTSEDFGNVTNLLWGNARTFHEITTHWIFSYPWYP